MSGDRGESNDEGKYILYYCIIQYVKGVPYINVDTTRHRGAPCVRRPPDCRRQAEIIAST